MKTVLKSLLALVVLSIGAAAGAETRQRFLEEGIAHLAGGRAQVSPRLAASFRDSRPVVRRTRLHARPIAG